MTDLQAAIGIVQLGRLADLVAGRRAMAARYHELLADVPGVSPVHDPAHGTTNYQAFWVLLAEGTDRRAALCSLAAEGVRPGAGSWPRTWNRPMPACATCRCR